MFSSSALHNGFEGWLAGGRCRGARQRGGGGCSSPGAWGACIDVVPTSAGYRHPSGARCASEFRDGDVLVDENGLHILARGRESGYAGIFASAQRASYNHSSSDASSDAFSDASTLPDVAELAAREHFMRSVSVPSWRAQSESQAASLRQGAAAPRGAASLSGLGLKRFRTSPKSAAQPHGRVMAGMSKLFLGDAAVPALTSRAGNPPTTASRGHLVPPSSLGLSAQGHRKMSTGRKTEVRFADIRKVRVIGKGNSASVWLCEDESNHSSLAMKQLSLDGDEDRRSMAVRELVTIYGVEHENIVTCHNVFYSNSSFYLVMELMDGGSLLDVMTRSAALGNARAMPAAALAAMAVDVLNAMAFLHDELKVIHRDIKPGNILLSTCGRAKLGDLGIATRPGEVQVDPRGDAVAYGCGCSTPAIEWIGTMKYMSPERLSGDCYSFSADVWSLGMVLTEAALGRYPVTELAAATHGTTTTENGPAIEFWDLHDIVKNGECPSRLLERHGAEWAQLQAVAEACLRKDGSQRPCARDLLAPCNRTPSCALADGHGCSSSCSFLSCAQPHVLAAWIHSAAGDDSGDSASTAASSGNSEACTRSEALLDASSEGVQGLVEYEGSEADGWL